MLSKMSKMQLFNNFLKSISISFLFFIPVANIAAGQERTASSKPSAEPDRIVLNINGDPATSMAVTWRTDTTVSESIAKISGNLPTIFLADSAKEVNGTYIDVEGDGVVDRYHSITFKELLPETEYAYCLGSGAHASEWFNFTTASAEPDPFTFIYLGDSQGSNSLYSRVIRKAFRSEPEAAFIIFSGDLVDGGTGGVLQDDEWAGWHDAAGFITAELPVAPVPGNHEYYDPADRQKRELNRYWRPGFTLPENGPSGLEETAYTYDYHDVRFIFINSNEMMRNADFAQTQALWVEKLLKENPCRWTFMIFHHPVFSTAAGRDNYTVRNLLKPLIDQYHVDMVLTGHDHTYARGTVMPAGEEKKGWRSGTVYVVSVSGAKQYSQDASRWWEVGLTNTQTWQAITIDKNKLTYKAFNAAGELADGFIITKRKNDRKVLRDLPENRK
jgi:3',5'-cyclic AMP phosphodiesterase CpdA